MQIEVEGVLVQVQRKRVKNLNMSLHTQRGEVRVSAPLSMSDKAIAEFVYSHKDWIKKHLSSGEKFPEKQPLSYVTGEQLCVFGTWYSLRVDYEKNGKSLVLKDGEAVLTVRENSTAEQRERVVNEWYRAELKEKIGTYLPKWERITGLYCTSWQIKNMKTRWGTCNVKTKKIWLNLQLAKQPIDCVEQVILHELLHLKIRGHGADFKAEMDRYMPSWREVKKRLNSREL